MKTKYFLFLSLAILLITFVSASFTLGNPPESLIAKYSPNSNIEGNINISLTNELANNLFEDSRGNSINVIELLEQNPGYDYDCVPLNCNSDYSATNGTTVKTAILNAGGEKSFGFKFNGNIEEINSISFKVQSNATSNCTNQLKIDLFNDNSIDTGNTKAISGSCFSELSYGCFDPLKSAAEFSIDNNGYFCQKVTLPEASGFKLGAWIKKVSGSKTITMELYSIEKGDWVPGTQCQLTGISTTGREVDCNINYLVTHESDYYVCLNSSSDTGDYRLKRYLDYENGCGFHGAPVPSSTPAVYQIFAKAQIFDSVGTLNIANTLPSGENFAELVEYYIVKNYGSLDCSANDCVVPFKIISGVNAQTITLKNLIINYDIRNAGSATETNFSELTETPATINSRTQKLSLNAGNFSVPSEYGDYTFKLYLNEEKVLEKKISVEKFPEIKRISPTKTASAFPTTFEVNVEYNGNISKYEWDFGDNSTIKNTTTNTITHTYNKIGNYKLTVAIFDSQNKTISKTFDIIVDSPEEIIGILLENNLAYLENVKLQISEFDSFSQTKIKEVLDIDSVDSSLKELQQSFLTAGDNSETLEGILTELLSLEIPQLITQSAMSTPITFYPASENVNLDVLQTIAGGEYDDKTVYKDAIYSWNLENLDTKISFKEFSVVYEQGEEILLKVFAVTIYESSTLEETPYFIIKMMDDLSFKKNYSEEEESGYYYIELISSEEIVFATTEDVDFVELPLFISPSLSEINLGEIGDYTDTEKEGKLSKWMLFVLIIILLVLIGIIVYMFLQIWYKRKYENYLFKNRNNLYNIMTYINNAKKKGLGKEEIAGNLRKAKWKNEQINYALKKYHGKRTGMAELPIAKLLEKSDEKKPVKKE